MNITKSDLMKMKFCFASSLCNRNLCSSILSKYLNNWRTDDGFPKCLLSEISQHYSKRSTSLKRFDNYVSHIFILTFNLNSHTHFKSILASYPNTLLKTCSGVKWVWLFHQTPLEAHFLKYNAHAITILQYLSVCLF